MQILETIASVTTLSQIFAADLVLGADNALLIALAVRFCKPSDVPRVAFLGTCGAIAMRLFLAMMAGSLLLIPYLRLLGAFFLLYIAIHLNAKAPSDSARRPGLLQQSPQGQDSRIWLTVLIIAVGDIILSLENILALSSIANGQTAFFALGVLLSIPMLVYGSRIVVDLFTNYPFVITIGAALLAWSAGSMAVTEPAFADWISAQSPALQFVLPAICALSVVAQGWHDSQSGLARRFLYREYLHRRESRAAIVMEASLPVFAFETVSAPDAGKLKAPSIAAEQSEAKATLEPAAAADGGSKIMLAGLVALFVIVSVVLIATMVISASKQPSVPVSGDYAVEPK